ncbi:hypothetical protein [Paenibacillus chitinolyticus]|uniref:hypothetical protein n=1 Tax=Paenibacillus chitinolyticus TaxID=79263 RepID=UPI00366C849D
MLSKIYKTVLSIGLLTSLATTSSVFAESSPKEVINKPLPANVPINAKKTDLKKITEIVEKYDIGVPFSKEDSDYIKANSLKASASSGQGINIQALQSKNLFFRGVNWNNAASGELNGYLYNTINLVNHITKSNFYVDEIYDKYQPKITASFSVVGYGAIGSDGIIGKVVDQNFPVECANANFCMHNKDNYWSGYILNYSILPKGSINYGYGEIDISPGEMYEF